MLHNIWRMLETQAENVLVAQGATLDSVFTERNTFVASVADSPCNLHLWTLCPNAGCLA